MEVLSSSLLISLALRPLLKLLKLLVSHAVEAMIILQNFGVEIGQEIPFVINSTWATTKVHIIFS